MKKTQQILILIALLTFTAFAQENVKLDEFNDVSKQVSSAKSFRDFKNILSDLDKIYGKTKKRLHKDHKTFAGINLEHALLRKNISRLMLKKLFTPGNSDGELRIFHKTHPKNVKKIEHLLKEAIQIYEQILKIEDSNLAILKFELAKFYKKYGRYSNLKEKVEHYNKFQILYLQAKTLREKLFGKNDHLALVIGLKLADNYLQIADFEKALPLYEKYIIGFSEKYSPKSKVLLPVLNKTGAIWKLIGNTKKVEEIIKTILEINGEKSDSEIPLLLLSPRAKSYKVKGIKSKPIVNRTALVGVRRDVITGQVISSPVTRNNNSRSSPVYTSLNTSSFAGTYSIKTIVTVDKEGKVTTVKAEIDDAKLKKKIEKEVKKWEFNPFIYEGKKMEMKGLIYYRVSSAKKLKPKK